MNHGLTERDLENINKACMSFPEVEEAILFGSRAKGTYKKGSDVDLVIKGESVTHTTAIRLSDMLNEELPLPYFFDVLEYASISNEHLLEHIDRVGVILYKKFSNGAGDEP